MAVATNKDEGLAQVRVLVATFAANVEHYRSRDFDETSTRTAFIDRLFEALGWDVTSASPDREVVFHARTSYVGTAAGADEWDSDLTQEQLDARAERTEIPDYTFSLAGQVRFCVEAKRPHAGIRGRDSTFQVKTYAWNRYLPFSVITDFDRLRVFATTQRPDRDSPNSGLMPGFDLSHGDYETNWDHLWGLLSREAVLAGDAERTARRATPRGAVTVDESFLRDLALWREELGQDLLVRHPDLTAYELDEATQRILDRLVFVRVVEDRNVEPNVVLRRYARLTDSYRALCGEFRRLDAVYNGQLFAEHHSERLEVSDGVIQRIIAGLYAVDGSPYRFDVFKADFLGKVYERFLGKEFVIDGGNAVLVDKPEVRHAGGVFYTPRWVVDHIVASTLDPLLDGRTPKQVAGLRLVDPACGSGTFLLGLFDRLIHWHEEYYTANPAKDPDRHYLDRQGRRRLTSDFKGQIALNNIYGADIDPQAVEVAQMSLYLRILEEESAATLFSQPRLIEGARLPSLSRNIRSGNSLIETADVPPELHADFDARRAINPFDWADDTRGFGAVFSDGGGFDAVVGNPPYTRVQALRRFHPDATKIVEQKYVTAAAGFDLANLFTERALGLLRPPSGKRPGGTLSFITSRGFAETDSGEPLRELLSKGRHVRSIVDFGAGLVFDEAGAYTVILTAAAKPQPTWLLTRVPDPPSGEQLAGSLRSDLLTATVPAGDLDGQPWTLSLPAEDALLRRLAAAHPTLGTVSGDSIFQGVITGADSVFRAHDAGPDPDCSSRRLVRPFSADAGAAPLSFELSLLRPVYAGKSDFRPFQAGPSHEWIVLPYRVPDAGGSMVLLPFSQLEQEAPGVAAWLSLNRDALANRSGTWTDQNWHSYSRRQNLEKFASPKTMVPSMLDRLCAVHDTAGHYFVNVSTGGYGIGNDPAAGADPEYVAALLNSTLLTWVLKRMSRAWRGGWFEARKGNLQRLPIAVPEADEQHHIVALHAQVMAAVAAQTADADDAGAARIAAVATATFDHAVYRLYDLSFAEMDVLAAAD
ncbi:unannotated protein [freshwater metagenome]|uniref:site-specific DNA-methyltransferase (adenine-specific) n=1 Tax=freshwater metagenome TaxID=449393 RepID=A0A6J7FX92_9ZZZZ